MCFIYKFRYIQVDYLCCFNMVFLGHSTYNYKIFLIYKFYIMGILYIRMATILNLKHSNYNVSIYM